MRIRTENKIAVRSMLWFALVVLLLCRPTHAQSVTEYALPASGSGPIGITGGSDGGFWFTEFSANKIGRISSSGVITEYTIPTQNSGPTGITLGPDGALWFTERLVAKIGQITTGGVITEYPLPSATSAPMGIVTGPDGGLWFTEFSGNKIGRFGTDAVITEFSIPTPASQPTAITVAFNSLWFTEANGNKIGRITTAGVITEFPVPVVASSPNSIVLGVDQALWFTEATGNKIGRITTAGAITEYSVPTQGSRPTGIASGSNGGLWFTETQGNNIGQISLSGTITEYPIPTQGSQATGIAASNGALWFTEQAVGRIGTITPAPLKITNTCPAPVGVAGLPYSLNMSATGGIAPYGPWTVTGGFLPAGVTLNSQTGVISGSPTDAGTYPVTISISDNAQALVDAPPATATYSCNIVIAAPLVPTAPCPALAGTLRAPYSFPVTVSGGLAPLTWALQSGALPPGLTLNPQTGEISGVPTATGSYSLTVRITDSSGLQFAVYSCAIVIAPPQPLAIAATCPAAGGVQGAPYSFAVSAVGGRVPLSWALTSGSLPPGLTLNATNGLITGIPTASGTYPITVRVTESAPLNTVAVFQPATADYTCSIVIAPALSITTACPGPIPLNAPYSLTIGTTGGQGPRTFTLVSGTLPPGLTLNPSTGVISGTPTATGSYPIAITAADSSTSGNRVLPTFTCTIVVSIASLTITAPCPATAGMQGTSYSFPITATGGQGQLTWTLTSGTLPPGLTLNTSTGVISGTPAKSGAYPITVRVNDSANGSATYTCSIGISPPVNTSELYYIVDQGRVLTMSVDGTVMALFATVPGAYGRPVIDSAGNVYVAKTGSPAGVIKIAPSGAATTFFSGSPLVNPVTLAMDAAGNILVGDNAADALFRIAKDGTTITQVASFPVPSPNEAQSISIVADPAGNYIVSSDEAGQGKIYSITPAGVISTILSGSQIQKMSGLVYRAATDDFVVADYGRNALFVVTRAGTVTSLASGGLLCCSITDTAIDPTTGDLISVLSGASVIRTNQLGGSAQLRNTPPLASPNGIAVAANAITVNPSMLIFTSTNGSIPPPQTLTTNSPLSNSITATATVLTPANVNWLSVAVQPPGTNPGTIIVNANPNGLQPGSYSGSVNINSAGPVSASRSVGVTFVVNGPALTMTTACPLPTIRSGGTIAPIPLTATGGTGVYSFSAVGGLPPNLTIANGTIAGTVIASPGTYAFTLQVTDGQQTAQQQCGITIAPPPLQITGTCPASPINLGEPYTAVLSAAGGYESFAWSLSSGSLPPGLRINGNTITGSATAAGRFDYTLQASSGDQTGSLSCSLTVNAPQLRLTSGCPGNGTQGMPYGPFPLSAAGGLGAGSYTFSLTSGSLPSGVSLTGNTISGTPTAAGNTSFRIQVSSGTQTVTGDACSVSITPPQLNVTGTCPASPTLAGVALSPILLAVTGGQPPYKFNLTSDQDWLSLSSSGATASVSGTPPQPGAFPFTVTVNGSGPEAPKTFSCSLTINPAPLAVGGSCPANPVFANAALTVPLIASGGKGPYAWAVDGNSGLSVSNSTGAATNLTGTAPADPGNYNVNVTLTDSINSTPAKLSCPLTVQLAPLQITGACPASALDVPVSISVPLSAAGGKPPYAWSAAAPAWLALSSATGAATTLGTTGTPPSSGPFSFTVTLRDSANSNAATLQCNSAINPPPIPPVTITGLTLSGGLLSPVTGALQLASPAPLPLTGIVRLSFVSNAFGRADNPEVYFNIPPSANGGQQFAFTIVAGQQTIPLPPIQPGTVAGTVRVEVIQLNEGARDVLPTDHPFAELVIPRLAPVLTDVSIINETANGFEVQISGYSTPRDLTNVTLTFAARPGSTLQTTTLTKDVSDLFRGFYTSSVGSVFKVVVPVVVDGNKNDIGSVAATVINSVGSSNQIRKDR